MGDDQSEAAKRDPHCDTGAMPERFDGETRRLPGASKQWLIAQNETKSWAKVPNRAMS
jgi:hypothetical protein